MNKLSSILLASSLLFLPACGGGTDTDQVENTTPVPKPEPEVISESTSDDLTKANNSSLSTVSGLIPSTDPNDRLKQVEKGKSNPFSSIRPPAVVKVSPTTKVSKVKDKAIAKVDPAANNNNVALLKSKVGNGTAIDMENQLETAPTITSPTDAEEILVSGILDLQGQNVALIKTPWDTTPRSVRVGDVISDSTGNINVLVKEISFKESSASNVALIDDNQTFFRNLGTPNGVVVLEQYGQLVTKEVAQPASNQEEQVEQL